MILAAAAKSLQSCLTLCDPIDGSPSGSPVPGILQVRTLEWVAISFLRKEEILASQVALVVKNAPFSAGDIRSGLDPWVRKIPLGGHGNPLQYSFLENPMARGAVGSWSWT